MGVYEEGIVPVKISRLAEYISFLTQRVISSLRFVESYRIEQ